MARPLLFLDVDGVPSPIGPGCPVGFIEHHLFPGEAPVRISPAHRTWINAGLAGETKIRSL